MEAALERIRFIFDEFPNVICGVSGGKDSTVIFNLCLQVAREKNRLPLKVFWLDQEAEWQMVVDFIRDEIMTHPDIEPLWLQIPFKLSNATSPTEPWLNCWEPGKEELWMHPQDSISLKENRYGTDRFHELFGKFIEVEYPDTPTAYVAGVRAEESPTRATMLTSTPKYKWITWGKGFSKKRQHFTLYPIYDWSYTDIWKAIHDNGWSYCPLYDYMYQYGIKVRDMRVSNVHHETAVHTLFFLQEVEADTWNRLTASGGTDNFTRWWEPPRAAGRKELTPKEHDMDSACE
jgi:predicted phosphoadenosine phosphosulfate sulfurtransferase